MSISASQHNQTGIISQEMLLEHWQGHRRLTRRVIEAFPEEEFFNFSIGGMRPFAKMVAELLAIAGPGITQIVTNEHVDFDEKREGLTTKAAFLAEWDKTTELINEAWPRITAERFSERLNLFGQFDFPVIVNVQYFIDNEIHHRGQGYVYLRALGIEPPAFWER